MGSDLLPYFSQREHFELPSIATHSTTQPTECTYKMPTSPVPSTTNSTHLVRLCVKAILVRWNERDLDDATRIVEICTSISSCLMSCHDRGVSPNSRICLAALRNQSSELLALGWSCRALPHSLSPLADANATAKNWKIEQRLT